MTERQCCDGKCWQGRDCPLTCKPRPTIAELLQDPYEREDLKALRKRWDRLDQLDRRIAGWSITLLILAAIGIGLVRG